MLWYACTVSVVQSVVMLLLILKLVSISADIHLTVPKELLVEMAKARRLGEHMDNGKLISASLAYYTTMLRYAAEDWSVILRNPEGHEVIVDMAYARTQEQANDGETE